MSSRKRRTLRRSKGSWRDMERLGKVFEREGRKRGKLNEGIVDEILIELKREESILDFKQDWNLDRIGIDHLVYLLDGEIIAIQEKSSPRGKQAHYKKYGKYVKFKNQDIRCLVLVINTEHLVDRTDLKNDIEQYLTKENLKCYRRTKKERFFV